MENENRVPVTIFEQSEQPVRPDEALAGCFVQRGELVPAEYVVGEDGQVVRTPTESLRKRRAARAWFDDEGRERGFVFTRRMNSAAAALILDMVLSGLMLVQGVALLVILWLVTGMATPADMLASFAKLMGRPGITAGSATVDLGLILGIAACAASLVGHTLPAYLHSVRSGFSCMEAFRRGARLGRTLPRVIVCSLGFTYAWVLLYMLIGWIWPHSYFGGANFFASSLAGKSDGMIVTTCVTTCIVAPLAEEFLFRGVLLKSLSRYGACFAAVVSSVLFGLMHGNLVQTPFAILAGLALSYVAIRSGSIWPGILVHFIVNTFSTLCDLLIVLLPSRWSNIIAYSFFGVGSLCALGMIIILCRNARRIHFTPADPGSNHILLPRVNTRVRLRYLRAAFSLFMLAFWVTCVLSILISSGVIVLPEPVARIIL